jgi:hypothetical protein
MDAVDRWLSVNGSDRLPSVHIDAFRQFLLRAAQLPMQRQCQPNLMEATNNRTNQFAGPERRH